MGVSSSLASLESIPEDFEERPARKALTAAKSVVGGE